MQLTLGDRHHDITWRALVMGIVGVPTGSPSRSTIDVDALVRRAEELMGEGADLLEVQPLATAEATGAEDVERLVAAVEALHRRVDVPLACRTPSSAVVRAACAAGAVLVDDSSGFADPDHLAAAVEAGATLVVRPGCPEPGTVPDRSVERDVAALVAVARRAEQAGSAATRIVVDPALDRPGSGSNPLPLLRSSPVLAALGYPVLLSTADLGDPTRLVGPEVDRSHIGHAAHALGIIRGCRLLRTTDVRGARRVADVLAAVLADGASSEAAVRG